MLSRFAIDPAHASSTCEVRVRFCETDLMGIVHHASYLPWFELARIEWLRQRGVTYRDWAQQSVHLPVVDVFCEYKKPALFDDVLTITTMLSEVRSASLRFGYLIKREGDVIASGTTRLACVNAEHRPIRFPQFVLDVLRASEPEAR